MKKIGSVLKTGKFFVFMWVAFVLVAPQGCRDNDDTKPEIDNKVYRYIQELYFYVYYWNKEMDSYISINKKPPTSGSPEAYFESLKYDDKKATESDKKAGK